MGRKKHTEFEDEENIDWGTGKFSGNLFDKLEHEEDLDDEDDDFIESDEDEKTPIRPEDLISGEGEEDEPAKKVRKPPMKSKLIGKHSLKYDTIYKGKKETSTEDDYVPEHIIKNAGGSLDIDDGDLNGEESKSNIDSYRESVLKEQIYTVLKNNTDIKFHAHMRKPAKTDFNAYFALLTKELAPFGYTNSEIFIELSGYFSPNVWNMFVLLDKKFGKAIVLELKEKFGIKAIDKMGFIA
jgi:hypothetical protein